MKSITVIQTLYSNAAAFPGLGGLQIQAAVTEPARILQTLAATHVTVPKPGRDAFDLGQSDSGSFTPSWGVATNGSLIAGHVPSSATGNFSLEHYLGARTVNSLTAGGSLAISTGGNPTTTSPNYATCGSGNGAGSSLIYTLTGSANGYDLTNIVVNYQLQSTTNLSTTVWAIETNFVATQAVGTFTNSIVHYPQKFYRVVAY